MQLFDQIAARVFGPGRLDASSANAHHATMPLACGRDPVPPEAATSGLTSGRRRQHQRNASSSAIISRSAIVLHVPTPQIFSYWQATACPRAARKSATYRSPRSPILAALVPSVDTIASKKEFGSRSGAHERPGIRTLSTDRCVSSKGEAIQVRAPQ